MRAPYTRRPWSQDALNARGKRVSYDQSYLAQMWGEVHPSLGKHSMIEDYSDPHEDNNNNNDTDNDDNSSSLLTPDGTIDDRLVYALHNFVATVEGQASIIEGDNLILLDNSNSDWWLICCIRKREIGYIPAEDIETPFERLVRLYKRRNFDVRPLCLLPYALK